MHLIQAATLTLFSLAASASASTLQVNNYCTDSLWLTIANASVPYPKSFELASGVAYVQPIAGEANTLGVTKTDGYYAKDTPKFILGTTVKDKKLWWSISNVNANPFKDQHFNVSSPSKKVAEVCGSTTEYDGQDHNCLDADFTLAFNPCFE